MAQIGTYGSKIVFSTNDKKILTFRDLNRSVGGRYGIHEPISKRPKPEFLGAELQQITFSMDFYLGLGVDPRKMLETLESAAEKGYVAALVIGGKKIGSNKWSILKTQENWTHVTNKGLLMFASVDVTMQEYV